MNFSLGTAVAMFPYLFRLMDLLPKVMEAQKAGTPIILILEKYGPDFIELFKGFSSQLFPSLSVAAQVEAGALIAFDQPKVRWVQESLNRLLGAKLTVDGLYGGETKRVVEQFQKDHGVDIRDGWAGKITQTAIQTELNKLPSILTAAAA